MNLVIDFGNTRTKAAIFDNNQVVFKSDEIIPASIRELIAKYNPDHTIVSSVSADNKTIRDLVGFDPLTLNYHTKLPFDLQYKTPETLGLDRIAAVAGAQYLRPKVNCLVIDSGTCITYDLIDNHGVYHGGGISPGMNMRFKSLNTFTANLPLVSYSETKQLIGQTTKECIESGVIYGLIGEIGEIIRMYKDKFANLQIIMCGGDAKFFEKQLEASIFAAPELVLTGLNRILLYNVQNKS